MGNPVSFCSTLTVKTKSVVCTQLAPQWNHSPDHEVSLQSPKKIRLMAETRLQGSLEKRIRSSPNPILLRLGSSPWPSLVLLDGEIQFCCHQWFEFVDRLCFAVLSEFYDKMWGKRKEVVCWGCEIPKESGA